MNQYITGAVIKRLREERKITQAELAEKIGVSDKAVSKWETGRGFPDISLLEPLSEVFGVSISELISGITSKNMNVSANMMRSKFYVCPICGNAIHTMGEAAINCHGVNLLPLEAEEADEEHKIIFDVIEDEYFVRTAHEMSKTHYISFAAAISSDKIQMVKMYPESNPEVRFKINGVKKIFIYCNKDGLFQVDVGMKR